MHLTQFLCLALMAASPAAFGDASASNTLAETQIRSALADWVSAANRGDYKAALRVWAPDLIGWAPDGVEIPTSAKRHSPGFPCKRPGAHRLKILQAHDSAQWNSALSLLE